MKAVVWKGVRNIQIEERAVPQPGPGQALVRMQTGGICGSDLKLYAHGVLGTHKPTRPFIMGHEGTGTIIGLGAGVNSLAEGQPVCIDPLAACGTCFFCRRGEENLCENLDFKGVTGDGIFSEFMIARADQLVPLPERFDPRLATLIEPLSIAVQASRVMRFDPEAGILLIGAGTIGLLVLEVLRLSGCRHVLAVDIEDFALRRAEQLGTPATVNSRTQDLRQAVRETFGPRGPDVVIEASGSSDAQAQAFEFVRPGGSLVMIGISPEPIIGINVNRLVRSNLRVYGTVRATPDSFATAVRLVTGGEVTAGYLVSRVFPLDQAGEAFECVLDKNNQVTKCVLAME